MSLRRGIKGCVFAIAWIVVLPFTALSWIEKVCRLGEGAFQTCAQGLALIPGPIGRLLRGAFYFTALEECSWELHVGFGSVFVHRGARIDPNVSTGLYCVIGHATIESGVMMASHVSIPSGKRQHLDASGGISSETRYDRVRIGGRTWIGEGAIIMADVGPRCIVSAGAIVIDAMPEATLVGGNPARVVKQLEQRSASLKEIV